MLLARCMKCQTAEDGSLASLVVLARCSSATTPLSPLWRSVAHLHAEGEGPICADHCCAACAARRGDVSRDFRAARVRVAIRAVRSPVGKLIS